MGMRPLDSRLRVDIQCIALDVKEVLQSVDGWDEVWSDAGKTFLRPARTWYLTQNFLLPVPTLQCTGSILQILPSSILLNFQMSVCCVLCVSPQEWHLTYSPLEYKPYIFWTLMNRWPLVFWKLVTATIHWPLGDHLMITCWPLGDHLVTTWWLIGDH